MHWIIGTAGHIDHGKTSLVKALTGQSIPTGSRKRRPAASRSISASPRSSCRWPPRRRGRRAGARAVHPQHARRGPRHRPVLFTVAADDGVMPQTEEHLDIIHLLGRRSRRVRHHQVRSGDERQLQAVRRRNSTSWPAIRRSIGSPIVTFIRHGCGLSTLHAAIGDALQGHRQAAVDGYFRLPVDRAFVSPGHGVIVTGTAVCGERPGDTVRCLPGNDLLRVRSIEVHSQPADAAQEGTAHRAEPRRLDPRPLERGDVIVDEAMTLTCDRFDARVEVRPTSPSRPQVSSAGAGVYRDIGADGEDHSARISRQAGPGSHRAGRVRVCQIRVSRPLLAMRGDRFILRDETGQRTVGGGRVMLPAAPIHKRRDPALLDTLETFERGERAGARFIAALVESSGEFTIARSSLSQLLNRREEDVRRQFEGLEGVHVFSGEGGAHYASEEACRAIKRALTESLGRWHTAHPLVAGLDIEDARNALIVQVPPRISACSSWSWSSSRPSSAMETYCVSRATRSWCRTPTPVFAERITAILGRTPLSPPDVKQIADELVVDRRKLIELMRAMEKGRSIVGVAPRFIFSATLSIGCERSSLANSRPAVGSPPPSSAIVITPPANMRFPCLNFSIAPV